MEEKTRIDKMVHDWNEHGRAFSHLNNNDNEFFTRIGIPYSAVGVTSQTGTDLLYYDTEIFCSDRNAIQNKRQTKAEKIAACLDEYFFKQLAEHPLPPYYVLKWSRDCDMAESSSISVYHSYISLTQSYAAFIESREWAEGPSSWQIVNPVPDEDLGTHTRDRAMEAYENGRGDSIFV